MKNSQVAEQWQTGLCGIAKHFFTDGKAIWSYGRHFPIAFRANNGQVYFNGDTYSTTTSKHQGYVARILGFSTHKELVKTVKAGVSTIILLDTEKLQSLIKISRI